MLILHEPYIQSFSVPDVQFVSIKSSMWSSMYILDAGADVLQMK